MENAYLDTKAIQELDGMNFIIPCFQRGYRWEEQQVKDFLDDIYEFDDTNDNWYCIQPLVVRKISPQNAIENIAKLFSNGEKPNSIEPIKNELKATWEVIDGQQRLTTIFIILSVIRNGETFYDLKYESRPGSADFLKNISSEGISKEKSEENIDYYHMHKAMLTVKEWLKGKRDGTDKSFEFKLLSNVRFIWYETAEENPIKVFTRLNIGKIPLTNSELIKASLLNSSNFKNENSDDLRIRLQQKEIASQWDNIEYTLQNDEFWLFINDLSYKNPTRIDFIFDLIRKLKKLGTFDNIGTDKDKTFRYFYEYTKRNNQNNKCISPWEEVFNVFQTFREWHNDITLYHYVGYLIEQGKVKISDLYKEWINVENKENFIEILKEKIKGTIEKCKDLNKQYELTDQSGKTDKKAICKPLLLLYNIQTVIKTNEAFVNAEKYGLSSFYKFPFHLYKKEAMKENRKGWEVEHIASNAGDMNDTVNRKMFLLSAKYIYSEDKESKIDEYLKCVGQKYVDQKKANELYNDALKELQELKLVNDMTPEEKNKIWNYALLDSTTNEEYRNSVFPIKRICINSKAKGKKTKIKYDNDKLDFKQDEGCIAFIPPCTMNVFSKSYTKVPDTLNSWTKKDAEAYVDDIYNTLEEFGVKKYESRHK